MSKFLLNIDECSKQIEKTFPDIEVLTRGICCNTCTLCEIEKDEYIVFKIYEEGMNRNIDRYESEEAKQVYISWNLSDDKLKAICEILAKYFVVEIPKNENQCIFISQEEL